MTDNETYFVKILLEVEMEGLPLEKKDKVMEAFHDNKITFDDHNRLILYKIEGK